MMPKITKGRKPRSVPVPLVRRTKGAPTTLEVVEEIDAARSQLRVALARLDAMSQRIAVYGVANTDPAFRDEIPF